MVTEYVPDQETRSQIGLFTYKFAQNSAKYALRESYKLIPGGKAFAEIVDQTVRDVKSANRRSKNEAEVVVAGGGRKISSNTTNLVAGVEKQGGGAVELGSDKVNQSPEDVLRIFMMKEFFMGNRFADELLLPQIKYLKKNQTEKFKD
ncbi:OLC1v1022958C1 [Oldenlandia corymbosa var. corymbosa]|uniref:OLC1v1022958C1 n=1 Tax=Oldenlandia corymbosa var. corymbosa TaxID=529605 RepID=A0AAV1BZ09_OLDCO|nr:OLC1v1022958C1 [Oldenlandia corymbosa var. corymbosa]